MPVFAPWPGRAMPGDGNAEMRWPAGPEWLPRGSEGGVQNWTVLGFLGFGKSLRFLVSGWLFVAGHLSFVVCCSPEGVAFGERYWLRSRATMPRRPRVRDRSEFGRVRRLIAVRVFAA